MFHFKRSAAPAEEPPALVIVPPRPEDGAPLEALLSKAEQLLIERARIERAIGQAQAELPLLEAAGRAALERLETAEAEAALAGQSEPDGIAAARRESSEARAKAESVGARVRGLQSKLSSIEKELREVRAEGLRTWEEFHQARVAEYRERFVRFALQLSALMREGYGLAAALADDNIIICLFLTTICDPSSRNRALLKDGKLGEALVDAAGLDGGPYQDIYRPDAPPAEAHAAIASLRGRIEALAKATPEGA